MDYPAYKFNMLAHLGPRRLSDGIVQELLEEIREGHYKVTERLPSERELAEGFGVSRVIIREALRILELLEVVQVRQGSGAFVTSSRVGSGGRLLRHWLLAHQEEVLELLEVREALETSAARDAATRGMAIELPETVSEIDLLVANDIRFHNSIGHASGNPVLASLIEQLNGVLEESRYAMFAIPGRSRHSYEDHLRIATAIRQRDPGAAHVAMRDHIARTKSEIQRLQGDSR